MPCYKPLKGFRSRVLTKNGKRGIVFSASEGFVDRPVELACGRCIGCRLEYSRQWAIRMYHESSLYPRNCMLTLTLDDDHLPPDGGLDKTLFPGFMKRLRKKFGAGPRYFHAGEYGDQFGRPHYHAILFNFDFDDKVPFKVRNGYQTYLSESLSKLWKFGLHEIGSVTFESAAYCARYVVKKITGDEADAHYTRCDPDTGEFFRVQPEFATMSRRPGIGQPWLDKYQRDVFPSDEVVMRGVSMKPPKAYSRRFELLSPKEFEIVRRRRLERASAHKADNTPERLRVREQVTLARISQLKREVE